MGTEKPEGDVSPGGVEMTDLLTPARIERDLALAEAASLPPWELRKGLPYSDGPVLFRGRFAENQTLVRWQRTDVEAWNNAEFIAAARDGYPAALREVQRLQAELKEWCDSKGLPASLKLIRQQVEADHALAIAFHQRSIDLLRAENKRLREALEPVLGLTTAIQMLLPAIRDKDVDTVNMVVGLIKGADELLAKALEGANND